MKRFDTQIHGYLMSLDISKLRLTNLPNFIFVCGGSTGCYGEGDQQKYFSMRGAILDVIATKHPRLNAKVQYAENYDDWLEHGVVKNLIDFELAIADMAGAIVLILEGPGAFAELGSFSVLNSLAKKLILVVNTNIVEEKTFINYGPIKYLEDNERLVLKYQWDVRYSVSGWNYDKVGSKIYSNKEDTINVASRITRKISESIDEISVGSPALDVNKIGHLCFIVGDLIYLFGALRVNEISSLVKDYFDASCTRNKIKTCLYILINFDFVKSVSNGDQYYVPTTDNVGFLKHYYVEDSLEELVGFSNKKDFMGNLLNILFEDDDDRFQSITGG